MTDIGDAGGGGLPRSLLSVALVFVRGVWLVGAVPRYGVGGFDARSERRGRHRLLVAPGAGERHPLDARAHDLIARAVRPGSAFACLDPIAGETVESACEKALFGHLKRPLRRYPMSLPSFRCWPPGPSSGPPRSEPPSHMGRSATLDRARPLRDRGACADGP